MENNERQTIALLSDLKAQLRDVIVQYKKLNEAATEKGCGQNFAAEYIQRSEMLIKKAYELGF